jgi:hypothetical protein
MRSVRDILALSLVLGGSACKAPFADSDVNTGYYRLVTIDNNLLPANIPCQDFFIRAGEIVLRRDGKVNYSVIYSHIVTGDTVTYAGDGKFTYANGYVMLDVMGKRSDQPAAARYKVSLPLRNDTLYREHVGAECDANSTEAYHLDDMAVY